MFCAPDSAQADALRKRVVRALYRAMMNRPREDDGRSSSTTTDELSLIWISSDWQVAPIARHTGLLFPVWSHVQRLPEFRLVREQEPKRPLAPSRPN